MSIHYARSPVFSLHLWSVSLLLIGVMLFLSRPEDLAPVPPQPPQAANSGGTNVGLRFEENRGQTDAQVHYLARAQGYTLFLTAHEAVVQQPGAAVPLRIRWAGAREAVRPVGAEALPGVSHYFSGAAGAGPRSVPGYAKVRYPEVYPGIDLIFHSTPQHVEYDFVLAPGADPAHIRLVFEGAAHLALNELGELIVTQTAEAPPLRFQAPVIYQSTPRGRVGVAGGYRLEGVDRVGFTLADYDNSLPLVIDPVLTLGSYLGGSGAEQAAAVASDAVGNLYLTGETLSVDFPNATGGNAGGTDVYVVKLDSGGTLTYAAYLGGSGKDRGFGIAVDGVNNAYVTGDTESGDFPVQSPLQAANAGGSDGFVTKLSVDGASLVYSTYLGGSANETARALTVDSSGRAYVTGGTTSVDFPVSPGAPQSGIVQVTNPITGDWYSDVFIVRLTAAGSAHEYSTYLGGDNLDTAIGIALAPGGEVVVAGATASSNLPVVNFTQQFFRGVPEDAFIAQLNATGDGFDYVSYLGGNAWDRANAVAVDFAGDIYVAGSTNSDNFSGIDAGSVQSVYGGGRFDAFLAKIDATTRQIEYATYLGGEGVDEAHGVTLDNANNPWLVGATESVGFPLQNALQHQLLGSRDAFVAQYTGAGSLLSFSSYLGGTGDDAAAKAITDAGANIVLTGTTTSSDFPLFGAAQGVAGGSGDAFVTRISPVTSTADLALAMSVEDDFGRPGAPLNYDLTVTNLGPDAAGLVTVLNTLPDALRFDSASSTQGDCANNGGTVTCSAALIAVGGSAAFTITVVPRTRGTYTNTASVVRAQQVDPETSNNSASVDVDVASGDSSGGGASHWAWLLLGTGALLLRRRR